MLLFLSRLIALKLHKLGQNFLLKTEKRLLTIDNLSEVSLEISALKSIDPLLTSFERVNKPYNQSLTAVFVKTNSLQIIIEALSLLIILDIISTLDFHLLIYLKRSLLQLVGLDQ